MSIIEGLAIVCAVHALTKKVDNVYLSTAVLLLLLVLSVMTQDFVIVILSVYASMRAGAALVKASNS